MPKTAVATLAGRRTDARSAAAVRFPLENVQGVGERIAEVLKSENVIALVSSAACGADLIGIEKAKHLGIHRRIILPFPIIQFRHNSVSDCIGDWTLVFDRFVAEAEISGDLIVLDCHKIHDEEAAYEATNRRIISEALLLSKVLPGGPHRLISIIVWEGSPRDGNDMTQGFRRLVEDAEFESVHTVYTMS
jgi:hypothetical protein